MVAGCNKYGRETDMKTRHKQYAIRVKAEVRENMREGNSYCAQGRGQEA